MFNAKLTYMKTLGYLSPLTFVCHPFDESSYYCRESQAS